MNMIFEAFFTILTVMVLFSGCAGGPKELYYWGHYEDSIYDMYMQPGNAALSDEINRLVTQIEKTAAAGMFVPPGLHAHLGYLYAMEGDDATAVVHLETEKAKFPESTRFIDGMMARMKK